MLPKEFQTFLTDTLGVDLEKLKEAMTSDKEVEVNYKSGTLMDDESLNALKDKVKQDGYKEGKVAGVEMAIKSGKDKYSLDFEGKTIENFAEALSKKVLADAKIEPEKKVKDLSQSLEKLQRQYEEDLNAKGNEIQTLEQKINNFKINNDLIKHIPDGLKGLNANQFITLVKTELDFDYDEGNLVVKKGDTVLKDKLEKPLPVKDVFTDYARNNGWIGENGRGGGDDGGVGTRFKTEHDVYRYMEENKIDPLSAEGEKLLSEIKT